MSAAELPGAVLFACTMNAVRSPMAAAILHHLAGSRVRVVSAGVRPGERDAFVTAVMGEIGIDLRGTSCTPSANSTAPPSTSSSRSRPKRITRRSSWTRTMAVDVEYWPTLDATAMLGYGNRAQMLGYYRTVRDQLFRKIKQRFGLDGGPSV